MTDVSQEALDACAAEPIRIPGAIQPHGALAVVDPASLALRHASANFAEITGLELGAGASLADAPGAASLTAELRRWLEADDPIFLRALPLGRGVAQVVGHQTPQGLFLEFETPPGEEAESLEGLYPRLRAFLDVISRAGDLQSICDAAAREVAALTGFNRVMLYSFDAAGVGTVLSEVGDGVLPSYLGQRFPGSDIPPQARALYRLNRLRLIADADYTPSPVVPAVSPVDGQPLDLSLAGLRSVSPVHLEYMRNMGTGASMSVSILVDGELWGLISAHNAAPRHVNAQVRTACDMLGQVLSLQIEARIKADQTAERLALKEVETALLGSLAAVRSFEAGLEDNAEVWMRLARADGAAVVTHEGVRAVGRTPGPEAIRAIAQRLDAAKPEVFSTDSMAELWPEAAAYADAASGLLAVSISQLHPDYILWFRPEVLRTIEWSGDPNKPMEPRSHRLHPRKSFETWREQVNRRSIPWTEAEIESVAAFRTSIQSLVLRRAEERAELTDQLERLNNELESFSYSISHDLRAPFRHIVGYAELLTDREKNLDSKSRHYVQSIVESGLAAGQLVDDLLRFSQLGRAGLNLGRVDMGKLATEVRRSLERDQAGRNIEWRIGALPDAWGDGAMLRQVLQNLIDNALKYSATREAAVIAIEGEDLGHGTRYTVRDNGVGFEMAYVDKLFGVFQRLHRAEDFAGTGIGLALVKRIVDRHGGSVAAEGAPDEGAAFTFILPKRGESPRG